MRIGLSTSVIQRGKTGVAQHIFALTRALAALEANHEMVLFTLEEDLPLFDFLNGAFHIIPVPEKYRPPIKNILWHQMILPGLAAKHELDVLHVPSYRRMVLRSPCARVGTIHDLAPFHVSGKYDLARMFYGRVVVKRLAHRQDRIIAISENTARDIQRFFGIARQKIEVIHNGLEHGRFFPRSRSQAKQEAKHKYRFDKPFFLYVARLEHPGKNHVRLIDAFDRFKIRSRSDWQLVFGGSDWHGAEAIHERVKASPFREDIRSLGFIPNEDLPGLYRAADVFVYPSLYEGFGLPPLEAMACGTPVICSDRGSLAEVVGEAARIVDPENVEEMSLALGQFAEHGETREDYVRRGLLRAQLFNWKTTAQRTLEVYSALARNPVVKGLKSPSPRSALGPSSASL
jgi:glycosyltransferase involved in cell wall biosynthesis